MRLIRWLGGAAAMYLFTTVIMFPICVLLDVQYGWRLVTAVWLFMAYASAWLKK